MSNIAIPEEYLCPISLDIMRDPVIGPDGQTYDRPYIEQWLSMNNVSPLTRTPLTSRNLIPNIALRQTIEKFIQEQNTINNTNTNINNEIEDKNLEVKVYKNKINEESYLNIQIIPPEEGEQKESVIIIEIDVSGSMDLPVTVNTGTNVETDGLTRLDLVKHAVKTLIHMMNDKNYVSIIKFSHNAEVVLDVTQMTEQGKNTAIARLNGLYAAGNTNIWDGLRLGTEISNKPICKNKIVSQILLTDGVPNANPPRGIIHSLNTIVNNNSKHSISTFGFGYDVDSLLLNDISKIGKGLYSFIPDSTMVGSVFINFMSNILSGFAFNTKIKIGEYENKISTIQYGQPYEILIKETELTNPELTISYEIGLSEPKNINININEIVEENKNQVIRRYAIMKLLNGIEEFTNCANINTDVAITKINTIKSYIESINEEGLLTDILQDIYSVSEDSGQIYKSIERVDWYNKWGRHFLLSFIASHTLQVCSNFKDKSIQGYGGTMFKGFQDFGESEFVKIPAPTPSHRPQYSGNTTFTPVNMSNYINASGGCISGNSLISMGNDSQKRADEIKKGDIIKSRSCYAKIICVVKTKVEGGQLDMIQISNTLSITPYHPVYINNKWYFPIQMNNNPIKQNHEYVYDFVLDNGHIVYVDNKIGCVTLGHTFKEDIVKHHYFGSELVIQDLMKIEGYEDGEVIVNNTKFIRNEEGLISGIQC